MMATTLKIAERRVDELQEALRVAVKAKERAEKLMREMAAIDAALDQACEAIYNATLYDPEGVRDDAS
jgi:hypothetical protein